jgi:hypothetical protein
MAGWRTADASAGSGTIPVDGKHGTRKDEWPLTTGRCRGTRYLVGMCDGFRSPLIHTPVLAGGEGGQEMRRVSINRPSAACTVLAVIVASRITIAAGDARLESNRLHTCG